MEREAQGYPCYQHDMMMMYGFKYFYSIQIICTQLYGFKYFYQMIIIIRQAKVWTAIDRLSFI